MTSRYLRAPLRALFVPPSRPIRAPFAPGVLAPPLIPPSEREGAKALLGERQRLRHAKAPDKSTPFFIDGKETHA
jgi:hypothetical protein